MAVVSFIQFFSSGRLLNAIRMNSYEKSLKIQSPTFHATETPPGSVYRIFITDSFKTDMKLSSVGENLRVCHDSPLR